MWRANNRPDHTPHSIRADTPRGHNMEAPRSWQAPSAPGCTPPLPNPTPSRLPMLPKSMLLNQCKVVAFVINVPIPQKYIAIIVGFLFLSLSSILMHSGNPVAFVALTAYAECSSVRLRGLFLFGFLQLRRCLYILSGRHGGKRMPRAIQQTLLSWEKSICHSYSALARGLDTLRFSRDSGRFPAFIHIQPRE